MEFPKLQQDRFLRKDSNQNDGTKDAPYTVSNPVPKRGDDSLRKIGRPKGSEEDDGAPNILTGTVITSCFIQTSALPSRIEMQGNDTTFFDDTYEKNGEVVGDTSRIVFTHGSGKEGDVIVQGFIMEKRASIQDTYDNVFSFYALPPKQGKMNYMYFGRDGTGLYKQTNYIEFVVNHSNVPVTQSIANGVFAIGGTVDDDFISNVPNFGVIHNSIVGVAGEGYSVFLAGNGTGIIGVNSDILPFSAGIDIGSSGNKFGTFYGSVSACPLPTVENALELLEQIPEPAFVGERGHYGLDKKYFDDLTFPQELLYTNEKGKTDIEHNHLLGFLLKTVKELNSKINDLENRVKTLEEK